MVRDEWGWVGGDEEEGRGRVRKDKEEGGCGDVVGGLRGWEGRGGGGMEGSGGRGT